MATGPGNALNISSAGVVYFDGTATFTETGNGSTGQILQSAGASVPTWSTPTYPSASGTSGKILISNGTNNIYSTPTFPGSASATSRKIIVSDGTNWVASTETWAVPGSSGNVLTSDGTNWTSAAAPGGGVLSISGQLTSLQIKSLHGTPIQIVAAPGSGKYIQIINYFTSYVYGGSNVFTASASQTVQLYYGTANGYFTAAVNTNLTGTNSVFSTGVQNLTQSLTTGYPNAALNWYNPVSTEISGNAANNNVINYTIVYVIASF